MSKIPLGVDISNAIQSAKMQYHGALSLETSGVPDNISQAVHSAHSSLVAYLSQVSEVSEEIYLEFQTRLNTYISTLEDFSKAKTNRTIQL